jgi:LysR family glycine cleavage system transcriptional activator
MNRLAPLRAIQIFETLGRCDGLVESARRLDISAGAVSQQIKLLENALGVKLVTKEGKRMRLTATGRRYHESCLAAQATSIAARARR